MADIIKFPTDGERDDRGVAAELAKILVQRGAEPSVADQRARGLVPKFRAFERTLAGCSMTIETETDRERELVADLAHRFANLAKDVWIASALGVPYAGRK
jgi:hypothetical protein